MLVAVAVRAIARSAALQQVEQIVSRRYSFITSTGAACSSARIELILRTATLRLPALRGAEHALATCRKVLVEVNFRRRYEGACSFEELTGFLGARDFGLYRLYDINQAADTGWAHADALFVRPPLPA